MSPGISGFAVHVPRARVRLEDWCGWTGASWDKTRSVVGRSFRMKTPQESVYTLAAGAVLRLIERYDIDPQQVGLLALGTESSTDNSAGAVIVRGMVDRALVRAGKAPLARDCEVPEVKHACLGGIYALKSAIRYLASDGQDRQAIVVCCDIAEYERGSSGEPTQGAGAVAMLLEAEPRLLEVDLSRSGSASSYRGADFRKPVQRHRLDGYAARTQRHHDFPVFNGAYSTWCYLDQTARAVEAAARRADVSMTALLDEAAAVFMHRPYHWMPVQAMATLHVAALAQGEGGREALAEVASASGLELEVAVDELAASPDLFTLFHVDRTDEDPLPTARKLAQSWRKTPAFRRYTDERMTLGSDAMMDLGNLYTAALPAWLAAGMEDALGRGASLAGAPILAIGYGSGDAAEAIPMRVVPGWEAAAARIGLAESLAGAVDLDQPGYEALHDGGRHEDVARIPAGPFVVTRVGDANGPDFQDAGMEYYALVG